MTEFPSLPSSEDDFWGSADDVKDADVHPSCAQVFMLRDDECASEVFIDDSSSAVCDVDAEDTSAFSDSDSEDTTDASQSGVSIGAIITLARVNTCMLTASLALMVISSI